MRKLNKRGFWMGEESGKFILGIIAVVLLFILVFKIAGILSQNTQYEQAKYTLGEIERITSTLGDNEQEILFIESPKKWYLIIFYKEDLNNLPTNCFGKDCLCLCPEPIKEICEKEGICKIPDKKIWIFGNQEIRNIISLERIPLNLKIKRDRENIEISLKNDD